MKSALPLMGYRHTGQGRTIAVSNGSMMASRVDVFDSLDSRPLQLGRAPEFSRADLQQATVEVRNALEDVVVATAIAAQRARTYAELLDQALAALHDTYSIAPEPEAAQASPLLADVLSPREQEVLTLVAEGRSNKAIAEALFVSPNTIKTHIASLMNKLDAESRAQLAAIATRQGVRPNETSPLRDLEPLAS
ncbi:MAG: response regulator transcription factor [Chloroflexi bacterium]|nr:response regulator transcription factor [Chloroflexota bacterium]